MTFEELNNKWIQIKVKMSNRGEFSVRIEPPLPLLLKVQLFDILRNYIADDASMVVNYDKERIITQTKRVVYDFIRTCLHYKILWFNFPLKKFEMRSK